jgi:hypothetical protein
MNIFYLDKNINKCAEYHCDKHVVKMILEYTQILCSVYYYTNGIPNNIYKLTHKNHPCCIWCRESLSNWLWLKDMTLALYDEYKFRYNNKQHKSGELVELLPTPKINNIGITERPQAMPENFRNLDVITAYRNYYRSNKQHILRYTKRDIPEWI